MKRGRGTSSAQASHESAQRLARIADALESVYGVPPARRGRDLVGGLVRTILSQNTSDVNSRRAYHALRERFPDWGDVERANVRSIESAIRSGGLAKTKSRSIKNALRSTRAAQGSLDLGFLKHLSDEDVFQYLLALDGVGLKTAACVALFQLGRDVMPVDTHVHRVVGRLGVVGHPATRDATFRALQGIVPEGRSLSVHVNLINLGRAVCRPRDPHCDACPVAGDCEYAASS